MRGLNVGSGPYKAGEGWINTDLDPTVEPDYLSKFPFDVPEGPFDRIYLGHVLEHVPWGEVADFLALLWNERLAEGGRIVAVGPDVLMAIGLWKRGAAGVERVLDAIEGPDHRQAGREGTPDNNDILRHHWNCYQERLEHLFLDAGIPTQPTTLEALEQDGWPITSLVLDQCVVLSAPR